MFGNIDNAHVLLAESNNDNLNLISLYIENAGGIVSMAKTPEEIVKLALKDSYDLILMDKYMLNKNDLAMGEKLEIDGYQGPIVVLAEKVVNSSVNDCTLAFFGKEIDRSYFYHVFRQYLPHALNKKIPLQSSLLSEEPELLNLVKKYINKYPDMVNSLRESLNSNNDESFEMQLHDIKSTGGNYGFMLITDLAILSKAHLRNQKRNKIESLLNELESLHQRMLLALV